MINTTSFSRLIQCNFKKSGNKIVRMVHIFVNLFYCSFFIVLFRTVPVKASYIDPSVMTYAIQAIAGTAIALGAFVSVYWRKVRRIFVKELNIKKGSNYESNELYYNKPDGTVQRYLSQDSPKPAAQATDKTEKKTFKDLLATFLPAFSLSLALSFMLMAYAPFQLYFNNIHEFWFDFKLMLVPHFAATVLLFLVLFLCFIISYIIYDKFYDVLVFFVLYVFIGMYIQGNFMSGHLPPMDGTTIDWAAYTPDIRLSLVFWIVLLIVIAFLIRFLTPWLTKKIIPGICVVLSFVMIVTCVATGIRNNGFTEMEQYIAFTDGELELGEEKNFVILMFDALDSHTFKKILKDHPEYENVFKDFTYYPNTLGAYPYTQYSVPFILTGKWNENTEDFRSFETKAMDESPLFRELEDRGYDMRLYEDDLVYDSENRKRFSNVHNAGFKFYSRKHYLERMNSLIMFQYLPYFLKRLVKLKIDFKSLRAMNEEGEIFNFYFSNQQIYRGIQSSGISCSPHKNTFKFIHLDGAHVPFWYDKDVNIIDEETGTYPGMVECCVTIMNAYLQAMKDAGLYDNTVVIFMADHGYGYRDGEKTIELLDRANPFLMIKGVGENHEFEINEAPISFEDLQEAYDRLLNGKIGGEVFDWEAGDRRTRRYLEYAYTKEHHIVEYTTDGYADDVFSMTATGKEFNLSGN